MPSVSSILLRRVGTVCLLLLLPISAFGQVTSNIAGTVRDASGLALPGVTVEASSPALIEKARSVVTDGEGRYNIVDLRPGTYAVTFTLPGFSTVRREGIQLSVGFTATVNADLAVGGLQETITVTGETPVVDTQNVRQQTVVSNELLENLPTGSKGFSGLAKFVPGLSGGADSGGASGIYAANASHNVLHHGKGGMKIAYDGMQAQNLQGVGNTSYVFNPAMVEEAAVQTGGISAEDNATAVSLNMVPKEGGNTFRSEIGGLYTGEGLQSAGLGDTLRERGVTTEDRVLRMYDANLTVGGPIKRDRVWFFAASRFSGTKNQVGGIYFNKTMGTPIYTPDLERPAYRQQWLRSFGGRATWQMSPKNKLAFFGDYQSFMIRGIGAVESPEAHTVWSISPVGLYQVSWTSPVTSNLLLEAGVSFARGGFPSTREMHTDIFDFAVPSTQPSIFEASTGLRYNASNVYLTTNLQDRPAQRFTMSYVTGSHSFKAGLQLQQGIFKQFRAVNSDGRNRNCPDCPVWYTFLRGAPTTITLWDPPLTQARVKADLGLFAQDQWQIHRFTFNYGLRFDYMNAYAPEQRVAAGAFLPERVFAPVERLPEWSDLSPRVGVSYDLFGTGRTALKASAGRYLGKMGVAIAVSANPVTTSITNVNRTWIDANGDYVPDCDLRNYGANGECGPISNANFGQVNPNAQIYADDLIHGFGNRDYFWDASVELQHQMGPVALTGGWYRNWSDHYGALMNDPARGIPGGGGWPTGVIDNLAITPADFDPYCITAPVDSRLPRGGGYEVCGLYDIKPSKFGQGQELWARASDYGGKSRSSNFFTLGASARFDRLTVAGFLDTGRTVQDECFVVDSPQQLLNCRVVYPFSANTQVKLNGSYELPAGFLVSGILQNLPGPSYTADFAVPNSVVARSLGRNLASCGARTDCTASVTVPLIAPQTVFEPRYTLLDLRLTKTFPVSERVRVRANLDIYNVLNANAILSTVNTYGARWRWPTGTVGLGPGLAESRLVQFGGSISF